MQYREPRKLSDSKLKAYHWWLHSRYSREDVSREEVVKKHVEAVRVMEVRGLKHPGRDKLDRETDDDFAREGGPGSGHHGHAGRPGSVGGSTSVSGGQVGGVAGFTGRPLEEWPTYQKYEAEDWKMKKLEEFTGQGDAYLNSMQRDQGFDAEPELINEEQYR